MGVADIIPGISGGTIAFILGIYEQLIEAIKSVNMEFLRKLMQFKFKEGFQNVHWKFLSCLFGGIILAVLTLVHPISYLLEHQREYLFSFFFGLIIASILLIFKALKLRSFSNYLTIVAVTIGVLLFFRFTEASEFVTPNHLWFIFICGAIAISAMILPGISGSFILLLMGKYGYIVHALKDRELIVVAVFVLGIACGILSFVRILSFLFEKYHDQTISVLTGLVAGSLYKIWPWKKIAVAQILKAKEELAASVNYIPSEINADIVLSLFLIICGFLCAFLLNKSSQTDV